MVVAAVAAAVVVVEIVVAVVRLAAGRWIMILSSGDVDICVLGLGGRGSGRPRGGFAGTADAMLARESLVCMVVA